MERKRLGLHNKIKVRTSPEIKEQISRSFAISERIFDILKYQGRTQADLARLLQKSESEITRWLKGDHNFTEATIYRIEQALGENIFEIASGFKEAGKADVPAFKKELWSYVGHVATNYFPNVFVKQGNYEMIIPRKPNSCVGPFVAKQESSFKSINTFQGTRWVELAN